MIAQLTIAWQQSFRWPDHIVAPRQTRWEKLSSEVRGFSPHVKAALIAGSVGLITLAVSLVVGWITASAENSRLRTKIHDLELELLPFRNLAVQQFNKADAESLKKLAESMAALQKDYAEQLKKTERLEEEIEALRRSSDRTRQTISQLQRTIPAEQREDFVKSIGPPAEGAHSSGVQERLGRGTALRGRVAGFFQGKRFSDRIRFFNA